MGEPIMHYLTKCISCSHDFYLTEENPYYVCDKCAEKHKEHVIKLRTGYGLTVHMIENKRKAFAPYANFNQRLDCTKLGILVAGAGHKDKANVTLFFGKLTVHLAFTEEQLRSLERCLSQQIDFTKYAGKPDRSYQGHEREHHYATLNFREGELEIQAKFCFSHGQNSTDYGVIYGNLFFITQQGCFNLCMTGPQLHSLNGIVKALLA